MCDNSSTDNDNCNYLSDYVTSKRDEKWDNHRSSTQTIESIFKSSDEDMHSKQAGRMSYALEALRLDGQKTLTVKLS